MLFILKNVILYFPSIQILAKSNSFESLLRLYETYNETDVLETNYISDVTKKFSMQICPMYIRLLAHFAFLVIIRFMTKPVNVHQRREKFERSISSRLCHNYSSAGMSMKHRSGYREANAGRCTVTSLSTSNRLLIRRANDTDDKSSLRYTRIVCRLTRFKYFPFVLESDAVLQAK